MLNTLRLDSNEKVTNWISTVESLEKIKPFDINLAPTMTNLVNGRISINLTNQFWCEKTLLHYIITSF